MTTLARRVVSSLAMVAVIASASACDRTESSVATSTLPAPATTTTSPTTTSPTTTLATTTLATTTLATTTLATTTLATTPAPSTATQPTTPPPVVTTAPPADRVDVRAYFLRDERLVIAHRPVAGPAVLRGALEALVAGPSAAETAADMASAIPADTTLLGVDLDPDGLATVDLSGEFGTGGGSLSMTARVGQVVFTATQFPNVDRVAFRIDGVPVDTLGGEGLILTEPQRRMDVTRDLTGSVIIDMPAPGATVTSPIRITGEGDVYEAQFPIEIWRDGTQIGGIAPVTAGAMGTWGAFDVTIDVDAPPGPIRIVAYDEGGCGTDPECPPIIRTTVGVLLA